MIATQALVASLMGAGLITGAATAGAARGERDAPASQQSTPVVTGPVTGGHGAPTLGPPVPNTALPTLGPPVPNSAFDLADVGYTSEEYLLSGSATAYSASAALTPDGEWTAPAGRHSALHDAHRRLSAVESEEVQRHGRRRVVEREWRLRRLSHLGYFPQRDDP
jgi:Alpha/beta hydrolase domain